MSERNGGPSGGGRHGDPRAAIYPAIGIARLGNSESEHFLAPEVTDPLPEPPGFYRDFERCIETPVSTISRLRAERGRPGGH